MRSITMPATLKDIAKETGLSTATISKYLNGAKLREKNRIAIEQAIRKLDYTVNEYARGFKLNRSHIIGVIIPDLNNLFITNILVQMETLLREHDYSIMICYCHTDAALERELVHFLLGRMVDGIINMPVCATGEHLKPALSKKVPVLVLDRMISGLEGQIDNILIDNASIARRAVQSLIDQGHRQIGLIIGPTDYSTSRERLEGYRQALASSGIPVNDSLIAYSDFTVEGGYESLCHLLKCNPNMTAVFPTNYDMTLGSFIALKEQNIRIPDDMSFIGFDDMGLSRVTHPPLTIVAQPLEQLGIYAARRILSRLEDPDEVPVSITLSASLKIGTSVGVPRHVEDE